jgi:hypothetical protein
MWAWEYGDPTHKGIAWWLKAKDAVAKASTMVFNQQGSCRLEHFDFENALQASA